MADQDPFSGLRTGPWVGVNNDPVFQGLADENTVVPGGVIEDQSITNAKITNLNAEKIDAGTLSVTGSMKIQTTGTSPQLEVTSTGTVMRDNAGLTILEINGATTTLNADIINAGTINGSLVDVTNIDADNINAGALTLTPLTDGSGNAIVSTNFTVSNTGVITASSGTIGGYTLASDRLTNNGGGSGQFSGLIDTSGTGLAFFSGATDTAGADAKFTISNTGSVTAKDLTLIPTPSGTPPEQGIDAAAAAILIEPPTGIGAAVLHVTSSDGTGDFDSVGFTSSAGAAANAPATVVTDTVHNFKRGQFVSFHDVNATWNAITAAAPIQIISTPTTTSFTVEHFVILPAISSNSAGTIRAYKRLSVRAAGGMYVYRDGTNAGDIAAGSLVLGNNLANYGKDSLATVADGELAFIKSATPRYGSGANLYSKNGTTNVSTSGSFDVGGQLNVNGDLDIGVSDTSTAGAIVFKGGAGGSIRAFSATAGNDSLGIYNTAGTAGGFLVAENFYPGSQGSAFMGHDGNFTFNDSVDVTGNVTATGTFTATANVSINGAGLFHDTPTGVTLASGSTVGRTALWTVNTGTQYMLQRWTSTSTAALKKNISATSLAPEQVYNLSLVDFEYDREKFTELYPHINVEATGTQRGVIWEQVADVLPEAAVQGYGPGDPPTIDWEALYFGALVAIQDLNERVKALENPS